MIDKIKEINLKFSVAGYEDELTSYIIKETQGCCDQCYTDNIGNVICHKKGKGEKVLINIPISCDGIFVTHIEDSGKIKFHTVGTPKAENLLGAQVKDKNGKIIGIIFRIAKGQTSFPAMTFISIWESLIKKMQKVW